MPNLQKLLPSFSISCQNVMQQVEKPISETDVLRMIEESRQFNFQNIEPKERLQISYNLTLKDFKRRNCRQYAKQHHQDYQRQDIGELIKNKNTWQQQADQKTSRTYRKTREKHSRSNKNGLRHKTNESIKNKTYKPNPLLSGIFSQKYEDFNQYQDQQISEEQKQAFYEKLTDQPLNQQKHKHSKFEQAEQGRKDQESREIYTFNPIMMAPQKRKMKRVKITND